MQASHSYLLSQTQSATSVQLIVLLYDGLLRFSDQALNALQETPAQITEASLATQRALDILTELSSCLRHDLDPSFCARLSSLYSFFAQEFSLALQEQKAARIEGIFPLINELRNAWETIDQELSSTTPLDLHATV
jgi:flagellar secretion chaperone FliS